MVKTFRAKGATRFPTFWFQTRIAEMNSQNTQDAFQSSIFRLGGPTCVVSSLCRFWGSSLPVHFVQLCTSSYQNPCPIPARNGSTHCKHGIGPHFHTQSTNSDITLTMLPFSKLSSSSWVATKRCLPTASISLCTGGPPAHGPVSAAVWDFHSR